MRFWPFNRKDDSVVSHGFDSKLDNLYGKDAEVGGNSLYRPHCILTKYIVKESFVYIPDIIRCVDANGKVFEEYKGLHVMEDIFRRDIGLDNFGTYQGALHCEQLGIQSPSIALLWNIIAWAYRNKTDNSAGGKLFLKFLRDHERYVTNTITQWKKGEGKIIHYPPGNDFFEDNMERQVNRGLRKEYKINSKDYLGLRIENIFDNNKFAKDIMNITGLEDPEILIDLEKGFGKGISFSLPSVEWRDDCTDGTVLENTHSMFRVILGRGISSYGVLRGVTTNI